MKLNHTVRNKKPLKHSYRVARSNNVRSSNATIKVNKTYRSTTVVVDQKTGKNETTGKFYPMQNALTAISNYTFSQKTLLLDNNSDLMDGKFKDPKLPRLDYTGIWIAFWACARALRCCFFWEHRAHILSSVTADSFYIFPC